MFSCHSWTGCLAFVFSRASFVSFSRSLATRWRTHALALLLPRTLSPSLVGVCGPACLYGLSIRLFLFCPLSAVSLHGCTRIVDTLFWFPRCPPPLVLLPGSPALWLWLAYGGGGGPLPLVGVGWLCCAWGFCACWCCAFWSGGPECFVCPFLFSLSLADGWLWWRGGRAVFSTCLRRRSLRGRGLIPSAFTSLLYIAVLHGGTCLSLYVYVYVYCSLGCLPFW